MFKSGNSLAVRLPKGFELPQGKVLIRREGKALVIEEVSKGWPEAFFHEVRIERKDFGSDEVAYTEKKL